VNQAYTYGYQDGYQDGTQDGYEDGYGAAQKKGDARVKELEDLLSVAVKVIEAFDEDKGYTRRVSKEYEALKKAGFL
jgi:flagellar biosynthesis/type III secretory pathway protein FliH